MNLIPAILKKKKNRNGKVNIKIRISHNRQVRDIGTDFYIDPAFWKDSGKVDPKYENADYLNFEISKLLIQYQAKLLKINYRDLPISRIVAILRTDKEVSTDFSTYYREIIAEKRKVNVRTANLYNETLIKIEKFDHRPVLLFEDVSAGWLRRFELSMRESGNRASTISIHLRNIRAVFNWAIDDGVTSLGLFPFRRYKIPKGKEERVPLTVEQLRKLVYLKLESEFEERARLAFLLSFVMIGINNSDLYELPKSAISDGRIEFSRNKTSKDYSIKLEPEISDLLTQLQGKKDLVCFSDHFCNYDNFTHNINKRLKEVGKHINYPRLYMYAARHTWASIAKNDLNTDDNDIASALGHTIKGVTQAYTHRNRKIVDDINRKVLDLVFGKNKKEAGAS